jgi:predicted alpha/beta-fold hydrolase
MKLAQHPDLFDRTRLLQARTIEDFDDAVTAPVHGFAGSHDYYTRSSSIGFLGSIRVPTLLISAEDDPFLPAEVLDRVRAIAPANAFLQVEFEPHGGHVGFIAGRTPFAARHWAEERVIDFFGTFALR